MTQRFLPGMANALALTRAGKLTEATAELQQMLGGSPSAAPVSPKVRKPARKPLSETLRHIARGGMPEHGRMARDITPDARFTRHHHAGPHGSRDYMLFVPESAATGPMPVVVMLHGCTQTPQDFALGTGMNDLAEAQGVIVIYPAQPTGANMNKCWNWFRPEDQGRDAGEPAILAGIAQQVLQRADADASRVYAAGLSAGGAAAVILAQAYPDVFAAIGVHSGLASGAATDVAQAFAAMRNGAAGTKARHRVPTIVFHGTADATVAPGNANDVARQAQAGLKGSRSATTIRPDAGRPYERAMLTGADGRSLGEVWMIEGAGHAWSGGNAAGSYTDPDGPDASAEMLRFFAQHRLG